MTKILIVIIALFTLAFLFNLAYNAGKKQASNSNANHTSPAASSQNSVAPGPTTKTTVTTGPFCRSNAQSNVGTDAEWVVEMARRMQKDPNDLAATLDCVYLTYEYVFRDASALVCSLGKPGKARLSSVMMAALLELNLECSLDADKLVLAFDTDVAKAAKLRDDNFSWTSDDPRKSGGISEIIEFTDGSALKFDEDFGHWVAYQRN